MQESKGNWGDERAGVKPGRGVVTGHDLDSLGGLRLPFAPGPFYRLRPPPNREALALSLELAAMTYRLDLEPWMAAGWTDISIQIDNTLQSGVTRNESTNTERLHALVNSWKLYRAKSALHERNPLAQLTGAFRQRERSDTIKAVAMLHKDGPGRYIVALGFMGTGSRFYDWFSNFRLTTEDGFHKGFSQLADFFEESAGRILFPDTAAELGLEALTLGDILREMKSANSRFFLWMSGHSQGGAVMQVFCHRLMYAWGVLPQNMVGYGFASPTVAAGQRIFDPARYPLYHVLNSDDLVPRVGALLHLGLCLQHPADEAFRQASYGWDDPNSARDAFQALAPKMADTPTFLECCVTLCACLVEEVNEDGLAVLAEKKWAIAPVEKTLAFVGGKSQDILRSFRQYAENAYASLTGHGMEAGRLDLIQESLRPIVKQFTTREILGGLVSLFQPPHRIMREDFQTPGAYSRIVSQHWETLEPFIWANRVVPERHFAPQIAWHSGQLVAGPTLPGAKRRRPSVGGNPRKNVRHKGISARRMEKRP